jgi:4-amino-4-deoxy-L-arabinose transferase-like glycosyltransferase
MKIIHWKIPAWLLVPLLFTLGMLLFYPFRFRFEFDADEGINLIKAMMTLRGFELYSDIWSDQPPVFNAILTTWFRVLGMNVNVGRALVLGLSTVLLISAMQYLQRFWGLPHAILGLIALATLPFYGTLSVSIMIGLPSIALAMLAFVGLTRWHEDPRPHWLVFSAIFLALSVMTKLWTGILAPIFFMGIFIKKAEPF